MKIKIFIIVLLACGQDFYACEESEFRGGSGIVNLSFDSPDVDDSLKQSCFKFYWCKSGPFLCDTEWLCDIKFPSEVNSQAYKLFLLELESFVSDRNFLYEHRLALSKGLFCLSLALNSEIRDLHSNAKQCFTHPCKRTLCFNLYAYPAYLSIPSGVHKGIDARYYLAERCFKGDRFIPRLDEDFVVEEAGRKEVLRKMAPRSTREKPVNILRKLNGRQVGDRFGGRFAEKSELK